MLLTSVQLQRITEWRYRVIDRSLSTYLLTPFWNYLVEWIPPQVSPNMVTLVGFLCIVYSFQLVQLHLGSWPAWLMFTVTSLLVFFQNTLDALDGKHARRTRNSTPVGELFDHTCDALTTVLLGMNLLLMSGLTDSLTQISLLTCGMLIFLHEHLCALSSGVVIFDYLTGSGECTLIYLAVVAIQLFIPEWSLAWFPTSWIQGLVFTVLAGMVVETGRLVWDQKATRNGLWLIYALKGLELWGMSAGYLSPPSGQWEVLSYGLGYVVPIMEVIVCKMGQKELNQWVPVVSMLSLLDPFFNVLTVTTYLVTTFYQLCQHLNYSMFTPRTTVYFSGVFDPFHPNHARFAYLASQYGNRVVVGVHDEAQVSIYKKKPCLTLEQRCEMVRGCRWVDEVIPGAPLYLQGEEAEEFLAHHRINYVACSDEYETEEDEYYTYPREQGILKVIPRGEGISSSSLKKAFLNWFTPEEVVEHFGSLDLAPYITMSGALLA